MRSNKRISREECGPLISVVSTFLAILIKKPIDVCKRNAKLKLVAKMLKNRFKIDQTKFQARVDMQLRVGLTKGTDTNNIKLSLSFPWIFVTLTIHLFKLPACVVSNMCRKNCLRNYCIVLLNLSRILYYDLLFSHLNNVIIFLINMPKS